METTANLTDPQLRGIAVALGKHHAACPEPESFHEAVLALLDATGVTQEQRGIFGLSYQAGEDSVNEYYHN